MQHSDGKIKHKQACLRSQRQDNFSGPVHSWFHLLAILLSDLLPAKEASNWFSSLYPHTQCNAFCVMSNQVFFLQVQSSPLSGRPPKQPCTGGLQSSLTCGHLESYSQSWSPKEEYHTQVSAGHSRSGPLVRCSTPFGETSRHLPFKPYPQLSAEHECEEYGQVFSQRKAELASPWYVDKQPP